MERRLKRYTNRLLMFNKDEMKVIIQSFKNTFDKNQSEEVSHFIETKILAISQNFEEVFAYPKNSEEGRIRFKKELNEIPDIIQPSLVVENNPYLFKNKDETNQSSPELLESVILNHEQEHSVVISKLSPFDPETGLANTDYYSKSEKMIIDRKASKTNLGSKVIRELKTEYNSIEWQQTVLNIPQTIDFMNLSNEYDSNRIHQFDSQKTQPTSFSNKRKQFEETIGLKEPKKLDQLEEHEDSDGYDYLSLMSQYTSYQGCGLLLKPITLPIDSIDSKCNF